MKLVQKYLLRLLKMMQLMLWLAGAISQIKQAGLSKSRSVFTSLRCTANYVGVEIVSFDLFTVSGFILKVVLEPLTIVSESWWQSSFSNKPFKKRTNLFKQPFSKCTLR